MIPGCLTNTCKKKKKERKRERRKTRERLTQKLEEVEVPRPCASLEAPKEEKTNKQRPGRKRQPPVRTSKLETKTKQQKTVGWKQRQQEETAAVTLPPKKQEEPKQHTLQLTQQPGLPPKQEEKQQLKPF